MNQRINESIFIRHNSILNMAVIFTSSSSTSSNNNNNNLHLIG